MNRGSYYTIGGLRTPFFTGGGMPPTPTLRYGSGGYEKSAGCARLTARGNRFQRLCVKAFGEAARRAAHIWRLVTARGRHPIRQ